MTKLISTRLDETVLRKIEQIAKKMHLERSALIRKFILDGFQRTLLEENLRSVQAGDMSLEQAANDADVSVYDALEYARAKGFEIGLTEKTLDYEFKSFLKTRK
jgi:predicted transcriptional regulator